MSNTSSPYFMSVSDWQAPKLKLGDVAVVLFVGISLDENGFLTDLDCGDTTVVNVHANGAVTLANGFKFHADGRGYARNKATVISTHHVLKRTRDGNLPEVDGKLIAVPADRPGHCSTFED